MSPEYNPEHGERIACQVRDCRCVTGVIEWIAGEQVWVHVSPADLDDEDGEHYDRPER